MRGPFSETTSTLHALEVLDELAALADPLADVADWVADPRRSAVRAANRGGRRYRAVGSRPVDLEFALPASTRLAERYADWDRRRFTSASGSHVSVYQRP